MLIVLWARSLCDKSYVGSSDGSSDFGKTARYDNSVVQHPNVRDSNGDRHLEFESLVFDRF